MNYAGICVKSVTSLRGKTTCIIINRKKDRKTAKKERERQAERETERHREAERQRETERQREAEWQNDRKTER